LELSVEGFVVVAFVSAGISIVMVDDFVLKLLVVACLNANIRGWWASLLKKRCAEVMKFKQAQPVPTRHAPLCIQVRARMFKAIGALGLILFISSHPF
jgi:hypothetical protein